MGKSRSVCVWLCAVMVLMSAITARSYVWCFSVDGTKLERAVGERCEHPASDCEGTPTSQIASSGCIDLPVGQTGLLNGIHAEAPTAVVLVRTRGASLLPPPTLSVGVRVVTRTVAPDHPVLKRSVSLVI